MITLSFLLLSFLFTVFIQFLYLLYRTKHSSKIKLDTAVTMIVLGSGGHTTEMILLIKKLNPLRFSPIHFVLSHSDVTSESKVVSSKVLDGYKSDSIYWHKVHRSREVKQSWITTVWTTFIASLQSFYLFYKIKPHLIICNGPGTCVPICYSAFILKALGIWQSKIVFVESFCRVEKLSLSGILLYPIADKFIVQWQQLAKFYARAEYLGDRERFPVVDTSMQ